MTFPLRCPKCQALVVDRRSAVCTTCRVALPKEWVMTKDQIRKIQDADQHVRAEFKASMKFFQDVNPYE